MPKLSTEIDPKLILHLEKVMLIDRIGKKIRFAWPHSKNKKFAILEEQHYKREEYAEAVEKYFKKKYGGNGVGE